MVAWADMARREEVRLVVAWADMARREEVRRTRAEGMERHLADRPTPTLPAVRLLMTEAPMVALLLLLRARECLQGSNSLRLSTSEERWEPLVARRPRKSGWQR